MLIQVGVPASLLQTFCGTSSPEASLGGVERELWKLLPARLRDAWDSSGHRISSGEVEVRLPS
jgi:hypothetical protein